MWRVCFVTDKVKCRIPSLCLQMAPYQQDEIDGSSGTSRAAFAHSLKTMLLIQMILTLTQVRWGKICVPLLESEFFFYVLLWCYLLMALNQNDRYLQGPKGSEKMRKATFSFPASYIQSNLKEPVFVTLFTELRSFSKDTHQKMVLQSSEYIHYLFCGTPVSCVPRCLVVEYIVFEWMDDFERVG